MKCFPGRKEWFLFLNTALYISQIVGSSLPLYLTESDNELIEDLKARRKRQETSEICDFGSENDQSTCDWTNRNNATLWEFGAGSLSNWVGGSNKDASGDSKGGYIFFETSHLASDTSTRVAQNAFIESPQLPTTSSEGKCIAFSYAIHGLSAAGLRVLLHPISPDEDQSHQNAYDRILWSSKDSSNGNWLRAEVLYTYNKDHQVVFEGVAKEVADPFRKYRGYISVDNVARKPGSECRGHCTFEGGFCSWANEDNDDFQWSLGRGSHNPSTGPATDRSSYLHGGSEGGYCFIDTSYPRKPGDVAFLSSDDFEVTDPDSPLCLRFWTHMYGSGVGSLSVMIFDKEENTNTEVWRLSGESGNTWHQAQVVISSRSPFKITLVGKVGKNNLGDIAVDDISLIPGSCPTSPQVAAIQPGDCTFEVDECGWNNAAPRERVDDIDWDRISGQATRPIMIDHTLGTEKGYFMTLARSSVQRPGVRAWLVSKEVQGQVQPRCLSFWYILNEPYIDNIGPSLGALTVYLKTLDKKNSVVTTPIWRLYNHQSPEWRYAQATIVEVNYTVIIEGIWGSSRANGIIAIDDITFFNGFCSIMPESAFARPGECSFDRDTCDWSNETQANARASSTWKLATVSRRPANLADKTYGSPEGYAYYDLFNHNAASNKVRLLSPPVPAEQDPLCFTFWFAAFGAGEDAELRIIRQENSTNSDSTNEVLWELQAKHVDRTRPLWTPGQVTVEAATDFRLIFEGMATNGGFAIDDISFAPGKCNIRPDSAQPPEPEQDE